MSRQDRSPAPASDYWQKWLVAMLGFVITLLGSILATQTYILVEVRGITENVRENTRRINLLETNHQPQPWPNRDYQPPREVIPKEERRNTLRPEHD